MTKMAGRNNPKAPPWSDLPTELLSTIANSLSSSPIDILAFRSVCTSWHSSAPSRPPLLPLKHPCPRCPLRSRFTVANDVSILSLTTIFILHPRDFNNAGNEENSSLVLPNSWLLFVDELNPGKVCVRQPLAKSSYDIQLDFPRRLNLLDFHVSELGRFYSVSYVYNRVGSDVAKPRVWSVDVLKVVVSEDGSGAVALFEEGRLGLLRLDVGSEAQWEVLHDGKGFRFDDIVVYKGRVLGVDRRGRVYEIGLFGSKINSIGPPIAGGGGRRKRLVESLGSLYLVVRCVPRAREDKVAAFKIYELNEKTMKWMEVTSIGDRIFFFGCDFAFSASVQDFHGSIKKNCIMFKELSFQKYDGYDDDYTMFRSIVRPDLGIGVCHFDDASRVDAIGSCPGYSAVLWPPPDWIWLDDKSKRVGFLESAADRVLMKVADESLKAKFKELCPLLAAVTSIKDFTQQNVLTLVMEADIFRKFLNDVLLEVNKESESIKNNLLEDAMLRNRLSKSTNLLNQGKTSSSVKEESHDCSDSQQSTTKRSNDDDDGWLEREWLRRLGLHKELEIALKGMIQLFENNSTRFEEYRKCLLQAVASNETGSSKIGLSDS